MVAKPFIDAEEMIFDAERVTGLRDWGDPEFVENWRLLIKTMVREAGVRASSEAAARERVSMHMQGLLRVIDDLKRYPEIKDEVIEAPWMVFGLPRAGSSFLEGLLAQDPSNRSPHMWEILLPSPPPEAATYHTDPRIAEAQAALERQGLYSEKMRVMHSYAADVAEEDGFIWDLTGRGYYGAFFNLPSYRAAMDRKDMRPVLRFHKTFLQHHQWRNPGKRWVLKAPTLALYFNEMLDVYPDMRFIQNHRDLAKVIPSIANVRVALICMFSDGGASPTVVARQQMESLSDLLRRAQEFRDAHPDLNHRFYDAHFRDYVKDPIGAARGIYQRFDAKLDGNVVRHMEAWLARDHQTKGSKHVYTLADVGVTLGDIETYFGAYLRRYEVALEVPR